MGLSYYFGQKKCEVRVQRTASAWPPPRLPRVTAVCGAAWGPCWPLDLTATAGRASLQTRELVVHAGQSMPGSTLREHLEDGWGRNGTDEEEAEWGGEEIK